MASASLLDISRSGDEVTAVGHGFWTSEHADVLEEAVASAARAHPRPSAARIDLADVERMDTFGALLLERLRRAWTQDGVEPRVVGLKRRYGVLLQEMSRTGHDPQPPARHREAMVERLGHNVVAIGRDSTALLNFVGATVAASLRMATRPRTFRFTSMVNQIDRVGLRAVPIIILITFLIGCILAQQGIFHFRRFGAEIYVVDMVGVLVLRELGVLIVSIMIAGRSGSAYTAELGSMRMREEVDALRVMGFDPVEILVIPRIYALIIALPLLTFIGSMSALIGGGLLAWLYGGIAPGVFMDRLKDAISIDHFLVGIIKAPFMAGVIGIVACMEGLRVGGSAESLGYHTTASVVKAIFLVIVMDGVFAMFFASIDM
ncbi:MlaE family lipid ABC transporter permease subunit [Aquabacter spiritensis]|uniref:Phospholipid/cholesterol/gamma-HCH transport system permease protein n=1 Tax=Aquabacter spiritensis TaxID=933073 RepID=A0A4R3LMY4_9HYPH|nr:phospholipid/cholesterol/gamma-HCH transport system permease protein [Aquabacter spiritensis]